MFFVLGAVQKSPVQQRFRHTAPAKLTLLLICLSRMPPYASPLIDFNSISAITLFILSFQRSNIRNMHRLNQRRVDCIRVFLSNSGKSFF